MGIWLPGPADGAQVLRTALAGQTCYRLLPEPDLVANLTASVEVIRRRKQELTPAEITAELAEWIALPVRHLRSFDTERPPDEVADSIMQELRR